jgi:hypothetical protein
MDAVSTSEKPVNVYIAEDTHLHTCRRKNLKPHGILSSTFFTGEDEERYIL